jgi:hypothetical protein
MAKADRTPEVTLITVNEKIKELNEEQLRVVILLMVKGTDFAEALQVAQTYSVKGE